MNEDEGTHVGRPEADDKGRPESYDKGRPEADDIGRPEADDIEGLARMVAAAAAYKSTSGGDDILSHETRQLIDAAVRRFLRFLMVDA